MPYSSSGKLRTGRKLRSLSRGIFGAAGTVLLLAAILIVGIVTLLRAVPGERTIGLIICAVPISGMLGLAALWYIDSAKRRRGKSA